MSHTISCDRELLKLSEEERDNQWLQAKKEHNRYDVSFESVDGKVQRRSGVALSLRKNVIG